MHVTEVKVCVHEKRNHPHECGHYDCSVTLTAQANEHEVANRGALRRLRESASDQVKEKCDNWIAEIAEGLESAMMAFVKAFCEEYGGTLAMWLMKSEDDVAGTNGGE